MTDASDATTTAEPAAPASPQRRRGRRIGAVVATVLAVALFLVATMGIWAKRTVLSTDRVVAAVDAAAEDPAVIDALSARITTEIVELIDIDGLVQSLVPDGLDRLGPVIEAAVANVIKEQVANVVGSDRGRELIEGAVRVAHKKAIDILEGGGLSPDSVFSMVDGEVVLDVVPLIVRTIELLQENGVIPDSFDITEVAGQVSSSAIVQILSRVFGVTVPENFGQITVLDAQQVEKASATLGTAQQALSIFQKATFLLGIVALLFVALALYLSLDRRRTLAQLMLGIGIGALVMRIAIDRVVVAIDSAIDKAGAKAAAVNITESLTDSLARTLMVMALVGIMVGLIAVFLRPDVDGNRSKLAAVISTRVDAARIAVVGMGLAVLFITGLTPWVVVIVGALVVAGILFVNRNALVESA
ncbi:MAG: hypothetical protein RL238_1189 [Actinomycetota bacterium]